MADSAALFDQWRARSVWLRLCMVIVGAGWFAFMVERLALLTGASDTTQTIAALLAWLITAAILAYQLNDFREQP